MIDGVDTKGPYGYTFATVESLHVARSVQNVERFLSLFSFAGLAKSVDNYIVNSMKQQSELKSVVLKLKL